MLRVQGCAHVSMSRAYRVHIFRMVQWNVNIKDMTVQLCNKLHLIFRKASVEKAAL